MEERLNFFGEVLGLSPFRERLRQAKVALVGEEDVPSSKFGLSSLAQFHPLVSPKLWLGKPYVSRKVIVSNLVNHTQTPIASGWSVKKTQVLDYRGKRLTYDSHNGTDFSIPIGTKVCTAAEGKVVKIISEFNRGGLKIFIDHGEGLMTCYAHLARALVKVGEILRRGQVIALSGYSGLDAVVSFPFGIPHVHFNVWLNAIPIDPFGYHDKDSMWQAGSLPEPAPLAKDAIEDYEPAHYVAEMVDTVIAGCKTASERMRLAAIQDLEERATEVLVQMNYYPTRFAVNVNLYSYEHKRRPRLDLPFSKVDFDGVVFLDEL